MTKRLKAVKVQSKFLEETDKEIKRLEQVLKDLRDAYDSAGENSVLLTRYGLEIGRTVNLIECLHSFKKTLIKMGMK